MAGGPLSKPQITLQPFTAGDCARLIQWTPPAQALVQSAGPSFTFPLDMSQAADYLAPASGPSPTRRVYRAVLSNGGEVAGPIDLSNIDFENRVASVCRVLVDPDRRGLGIGRRMLRRVMRFGFDELQLHRLDLRVFSTRPRSRVTRRSVSYARGGFRIGSVCKMHIGASS